MGEDNSRTHPAAHSAYLCPKKTMSKTPAEALKETIKQLLDESAAKKRKFLETIELQIVLKNYDTQKDKRFAGSIKLPNLPRPACRAASSVTPSTSSRPRPPASLAWMSRPSRPSTRTRRRSRSL